jgi:hypothetical protein
MSAAQNIGMAKRAFSMAAGAILLWAPWAAWANHEYGWSIASRAALTQSSLSFFITLFMTFSIEAIAARQYSPWRQWSYSILGPCAVVLFFLVTVHLWVGTPNWLLTIAPSIVIGLVYTSIYSFWRSQIASGSAEPANATAN